jgi:filamentous hemagglutinin
MGNVIWSSLASTNGQDTANWNPARVPTAGDTALFDATSVVDCTFGAAGMSCDAITATAAYTGHIDLGDNAATFAISGNITLACHAFDMGTALVSCGGSFDFSGVTTWVTGTSTLTMTGTGNLSGIASSTSTLCNLTFANGSVIAITASTFVANLITFNGGATGTVTIATGQYLSTTSPGSIVHNSGVTSAAGTGYLRVRQPAAGKGLATFAGGTISSPVSVDGPNVAAVLASGTYGGLVTVKNSITSGGTWTPSVGTYNFNGGFSVTNDNTPIVTLGCTAAGVTLNITNYTITNSNAVSGTVVVTNTGNPTINVSGNISFTNTGFAFTYTAGTGLITLINGGNQTIALAGKTTEKFVVTKPAAGTVTWTNGDTIIAGGAWNRASALSLPNPSTVSLDMGDVGYSHVFSGGVSLLGGTFDCGTGNTITVSGNVDYSTVATWVAGTSTWVWAASGNLTGKTSSYFLNLTVNAGVTVTIVAASGAFVGTNSGTTTLVLTGSIVIPAGKTWYCKHLVLGVGSSISGLGAMILNAPAAAKGITGDPAALTCAGLTILTANSAAVIATGVYSIPVTVKNSGVTSCTWTPSATPTTPYTFAAGLTFTNDNAGSTTTIRCDTNNPNFTIGGNLTLTQTAGTLTYTKGTGTITLNGAVGQTITSLGRTLEDIVVNMATTNVHTTLAGNLVTDSFTLTKGTLESANLIANGGFGIAGAGGADIWASWTETAGNGAIAAETTLVHSGANAAKLTRGTPTNAQIVQSFVSVASTAYTLTFWARGDGTVAGQYRVFDNTGAAWITALTSTGVTGTAYTLVTVPFTTPVGCISCGIYLYAPSAAGIAYFDDVNVVATGYNITTTGNLTIGVDGQVSAATLAGSTWTVGGDFSATGEAGDLLTLNPAAAWTLTVTDEARATYVNAAYSNASGGADVHGVNCTDGGNNTNWLFAYSTTASGDSTTFLPIAQNGSVSSRELLPAVAGRAYRVVEWLLSSHSDAAVTFQTLAPLGVAVNLTGAINIAAKSTVGQKGAGGHGLLRGPSKDRGLFQTARGSNLQIAFDTETVSNGYLVYREC